MNEPKKFYEPTPEEIKARKKRNIAIALLLVGFIAFVVFVVISRGIVMTPGGRFEP